MKDIELPEPFAWALAYQTIGGDVGWKLSFNQSGVGVCKRLEGESNEAPLFTADQLRAAVEADRAQRVPDVDALSNFIREIDGAHRFGAGALAERICEWIASTPAPAQQEKSKVISKFTDAVFDLAKDLAGIPAPAPAQQEPDWKAMYEHEKRRSAMWIAKYEKDIGPLECAGPVSHQEPPQQERKPMTDAQAVKCIEAAGFKTWTSAHFRLVRQAERHHGIKE